MEPSDSESTPEEHESPKLSLSDPNKIEATATRPIDAMSTPQLEASPRPDPKPGRECPVCLETRLSLHQLPCKHLFCADCLLSLRYLSFPAPKDVTGKLIPGIGFRGGGRNFEENSTRTTNFLVLHGGEIDPHPSPPSQ